MADGQDARSGSGGILRIVTAVTALLTAIGGLVGALAAAGVFDDDDDRVVTTTTTAPPTSGGNQTTPTNTVAPPTTQPTTSTTLAPVADRAAVTLAYLGDAEGCSVDIAVDIADRSFVPIGNSFLAADVLTGLQSYSIAGIITCPFSGQCEAGGSGTIDVAAGRTFFVQWINSAIGFCDIALAAG